MVSFLQYLNVSKFILSKFDSSQLNGISYLQQGVDRMMFTLNPYLHVNLMIIN